MLTQERQNEILRILSEKEAVTVAQLSETLDASESTIRRDLNKLNKLGKLTKVFGGATVKSKQYEAKDDAVSIRSKLNAQEKREIGEYASNLINNFDLVYIDAGTTTKMMLEYIDNKNATYVTNALEHGQFLMQRGFNVYIIGGRLKASTECVVGADGVENMQKFNFTKCFLGTNGIDVKAGLTTPDIEEAHIKSEALRHSYAAFILADHTKFNRVYPVSFGALENTCIITGRLSDKKFAEHTVIKEVTV